MVNADPTLMQQLVTDFSTYLVSERMLSASTVERYVAVVDGFAEGFTAKSPGVAVDLAAVTKVELAAFLRAETAEGGEPSRAKWNNRLAALRAFYDYLFKQELVMVNPALRIERLRPRCRERLPLTFDEVLDLVDAIREHSPKSFRSRNEAIVQVFFHCSLRVAEVVSLSFAQVDMENRAFLSVRVKGDKRLAVLFNDVVAEALEHYLADRKKLGVPEGETGLFVSQRRRRISVRTVENLVSHYGQLAEISRPISPHVLRHASATELADFANIRVVQEHLGHSSVTTTEKYVHVRSGERRRAVDQLGVEWQREARRRRQGRKAAEEQQKTA